MQEAEIKRLLIPFCCTLSTWFEQRLLFGTLTLWTCYSAI